MNNSTTFKVFVYGTLRQGGYNHHLLAHATYHGMARTPPIYDLIDLGPFPAMTPGGSTAVVGEVYEVDAKTLAALDHLEGHPHLYWREEISLEDGENAFAYLIPCYS